MLRRVQIIRPFLPALALGLVYFALAALTILTTRLSGGIALLWVANGPLIAVLCAAPRSTWPRFVAACAIASIGASLLTSPVWHAAPLFAAANIGEGVVAAWLLHRYRVSDGFSESPTAVALFVLFAGLVGPLAGGLIGVPLEIFLFGNDVAGAALDWWIGHGVGNLIGAPFVILLLRGSFALGRTGRHWRFAGSMILVAATTMIVFGQDHWPILFLPFIPVLIATFGSGRTGAAASVMLVALIGGGLTSAGHGPVMLLHQPVAARLQFFQVYLAVLFLAALPVAAALAQRAKLLLALRESEARYRLLADHATDMLVTLSPEGVIRFISPSVQELTGHAPEALIGRPGAELVLPEDAAALRENHRRALANPERTHATEYRVRKADGTIGWFETNARAVFDADGQPSAIVAIVRDLSHRKTREDELVRAATTDPLTGLLNRSAFRRKAAEAMKGVRRGECSTLAIVDLDHFKRVNDSWGHAVGDQALLACADLLTRQVRDLDAVGRVGGEEFAILFRGLSLAQAQPVCERLRATLEETPVPHAAGQLSITMSIGMAELCSGFGLDPIFAAADTALYRAKARGRNRVEAAADVLA